MQSHMTRVLAGALASIALAVPVAGPALAQPCSADEIFGVRRLALVGEDPRALAYAIGGPGARAVILGGRVVYERPGAPPLW